MGAEADSVRLGMMTVTFLGIAALVGAMMLFLLGHTEGGIAVLALPLLSVIPKVIAAIRGSRPE